MTLLDVVLIPTVILLAILVVGAVALIAYHQATVRESHGRHRADDDQSLAAQVRDMPERYPAPPPQDGRTS